MFLLYKDKIKEIEDLYNKKDYYVVILESANMVERLINEFFNTFHAILTSKEDLKKYIEFQEHEGEKFSTFLKKPTIGIAIGFYTKLKQSFPALKPFEKDIKDLLNSVNDIRISHLHSKGKLATDEDAGKILDATEKIISASGYKDRPVESTGVPLKFYLISRSVIRKFQHADREEDYKKIIEDSLKIIPVLLKVFINKKFHELDLKEKYFLLDTLELWSNAKCSAADFNKFFEGTKILQNVNQGDSLKESMAFLAECKNDEFNRRATRHYVNTIEILLGELINDINIPVLNFADSVKRRYLAGNRIDNNDRMLLNDKAQELGIAPEIAQKIEIQVIETINKELILFQTLTDESEKTKQPSITDIVSRPPAKRRYVQFISLVLILFILGAAGIFFFVFYKKSSLTRFEKLALENKWNDVLRITQDKHDLTDTKAHFLYMLASGSVSDWNLPPTFNAKYRSLFKEHPESPEANFYLGASYFYNSDWMEQFDSAFILINKAVEMGLNTKEIDYVQRHFLGNLGFYNESFEVAKKLKDMPDPRAAYDAATTYLNNIYDTATAIQLINKAINLYPRYVDAYNLLAQISLNRNDLKEASFNINKSLEINPKDHSTIQLAARIKKTEGRFEEAENYFKDAIASFAKNNPSFYYDLIDIYANKDSFDLALNLLKESKTKFPDYYYFFYQEKQVQDEKENESKIKNKLIPAPDWTEDYEKAIERAKSEKKPILIDFTASWCYWCKVLDKKVYSDSLVNINLKDFIPVKINTEVNLKISSQYKINALPTILIINEDGKILKKNEGFLDKDNFMNFIKDGLEKYNIITKGKQVTEEKRTVATNFADAKILAKNRNFPILLVVGDKQSTWSNKLVEKTLASKEILSELDNMVYFYLDKNASDPILQQINPHSFPSLYFFNSKGQKIYESQGYKTPQHLQNLIVAVKDNLQSNNKIPAFVNWIYSIDEAKSYALINKKNMFLYVGLLSCPPCEGMESDVLNNPEIVSKLNKNFISVYINSSENPEIYADYNIVYMPSILILDESGKELFRRTSYIDKNSLIKWLDLEDKLKMVSVMGLEKYQSFSRRLYNAENLTQMGFPQSANNILNELDNEVPDNPEVIRLKAMANSNLHRYDQAVSYYEKAIKIGTDLRDELINDLILNYMELNHLNNGYIFLKNFISQSNLVLEKKSIIYRAIGRIYYLQNKLDSALYYYEAAIKSWPENLANQTAYGLLTYELNQLDRSEKAFQKAERLDKFNGVATVYRGLIAEKRGDWKTRDKFFKDAMLYNRRIIYSIRYDAYQFLNAENYWIYPKVKGEIENQCRIAIKLDSTAWQNYYLFNKYLISEQGFEQETLDFCKKNLEIENQFNNKFLLALAYLKNGQKEEALKTIKEVFGEIHEKQIRTDFDCLYSACKVLKLNGSEEEANHYYQLLKSCREIYGYKKLWMQDIDQLFAVHSAIK